MRARFADPEDVGGAVGRATRCVADGGVVLLPTESFYGLGVDPRQPAAVERVFALKGRPSGLALPVVCCDWQQVETLVEIPDRHRVRLGRIWPGALSVVVRCRAPVAAAVDATLAVRIPDHAMLRALLYRTGPLTATSANRHGEPPSADADRALASLLGDVDLVLDGGELAGGKVSTMVDLTGDEAVVIRRGAVAWDQLFDPESETVRDLEC